MTDLGLRFDIFDSLSQIFWSYSRFDCTWSKVFFPINRPIVNFTILFQICNFYLIKQIHFFD